MQIQLNNKIFVPLSNSQNGEISAETQFHYKQDGIVIWAEYYGGEIIKGFLIGKVINDAYLEFVYQHLNTKNQIMTGNCQSIPEFKKGRLLLNEKWQWTNADLSNGESILIEKIN